VPGFDVRVWFAVFMPAGAPRYAVNAVNERIGKMLEVPELRQRLIDQGADRRAARPKSSVRWSKPISRGGQSW
jgi:tripartite-type tricarboxylate transporter receptor subunit TctC